LPLDSIQGNETKFLGTTVEAVGQVISDNKIQVWRDLGFRERNVATESRFCLCLVSRRSTNLRGHPDLSVDKDFISWAGSDHVTGQTDNAFNELGPILMIHHDDVIAVRNKLFIRIEQSDQTFVFAYCGAHGARRHHKRPRVPVRVAVQKEIAADRCG